MSGHWSLICGRQCPEAATEKSRSRNSNGWGSVHNGDPISSQFKAAAARVMMVIIGFLSVSFIDN